MLWLLLTLACGDATPTDSGTPEPATIEAWFDFDADGVGGGESILIASWDDADPLLVPMGGDCDDGRSDIAPGYADDCDGIDNDCDGDIDEDAEVVTLWLDLDGDHAGSDGTTTPEITITGCDPWSEVDDPAHWTARGGDCDDTDPRISGAGLDWPDGLDNDCDGVVDNIAPTAR